MTEKINSSEWEWDVFPTFLSKFPVRLIEDLLKHNNLPQELKFIFWCSSVDKVSLAATLLIYSEKAQKKKTEGEVKAED